MITIVKKYKITGITDNFNIDVLVPDCASLISKSYDKATEILTLVLQYCDADCILNYDTIRVTLSYNDGFCFYLFYLFYRFYALSAHQRLFKYNNTHRAYLSSHCLSLHMDDELLVCYGCSCFE